MDKMDNRIKELDAKVKEEVNVKKGIETLEYIRNEFEKIDDIKSFVKKDKQEFRNLLLTLISWYDYIKSESDFHTYMDAVNIIDDIRYIHPELEEAIDDILFSSEKINNKNDTKSEKFNSYTDLKSKIYFLIEQLNPKGPINSDNVDDVKISLEIYKEELLKNRSNFSNQQFEELLDLLNSQLNWIDEFYLMVEKVNSLGR